MPLLFPNKGVAHGISVKRLGIFIEKSQDLLWPPAAGIGGRFPKSPLDRA
jgi:hypothetical protein